MLVSLVSAPATKSGVIGDRSTGWPGADSETSVRSVVRAHAMIILVSSGLASYGQLCSEVRKDCFSLLSFSVSFLFPAVWRSSCHIS